MFSMSFLVIYFFTILHITCYISSAKLKQAGTLDGLNNIKVVFDITCMLVMDNESLLDKSHRRTLNEMRRGNKVDSTDLKNSRVLKAMSVCECRKEFSLALRVKMQSLATVCSRRYVESPKVFSP